MTTHTMNTLMTNREISLAVLALPFLAIGRFIIKIGESSSRYKQIVALSDMSDEELSALGTDRQKEVIKIVGYVG